MNFFDFTHLSETQWVELEACLNSTNVKVLLSEFMGTDNCADQRKQSIATDFHFYNYAYCKDKAFSMRQSCSFMSIMKHIFKSDTDNEMSTPENSYEVFQNILLKHSVERPPVSIKIFTEDQVADIFDYVLNSYYRHFRLYKYIFSVRVVQVIEQLLPQEVELATPKLHALDAGLYVAKE